MTDERSAHQKRMDALVEEQREIARLNRAKAAKEQEEFGWGDQS